MKKITTAAQILSMIAALPLLVVAEMTHGTKATSQTKENIKDKVISQPLLFTTPVVAEKQETVYQYPTCITIGI